MQTIETLLMLAAVALIVYLVLKTKSKREAERKVREAELKAIEAAKPENKSGWYIGPEISGYPHGSPGMPTRPTIQDKGCFFDLPADPNTHIHYLQFFKPPSLVGAKQINMRYVITGGDFIPQEHPSRKAILSLIIQRKGDNWGAEGKYEAYRLYSSKVQELAAGEYVFNMPLDDHLQWGGVYSSRDRDAFYAALHDVENIGPVFGSAGGRGHGVYATQPSRFTLLEFEVEYSDGRRQLIYQPTPELMRA